MGNKKRSPRAPCQKPEGKQDSRCRPQNQDYQSEHEPEARRGNPTKQMQKPHDAPYQQSGGRRKPTPRLR